MTVLQDHWVEHGLFKANGTFRFRLHYLAMFLFVVFHVRGTHLTLHSKGFMLLFQNCDGLTVRLVFLFPILDLALSRTIMSEMTTRTSHVSMFFATAITAKELFAVCDQLVIGYFGAGEYPFGRLLLRR
jgi:hypothetical protein